MESQGHTLFIVDGAYVFLGALTLISATNRRFDSVILTKEKLKIIDDFIQTRINRIINEKHWITAEENVKTAESRT